MSQSEVLVQVVSDIDSGREIGSTVNFAERFEARLDDIREAIQAAAAAVARSLPGLHAADGWEVGEVSASFGVTRTAEAGVLITKTSAAATFDVTVKMQKVS